MKRIFISPSEARLRAGWRLLIQLILMLILMALTGIPVGLLSVVFNFSPQVFLLTGEVVSLFSITLSVYVARRLLDRRSFASLGLRHSPQAGLDVLVGILISSVLQGAMFLAEWGLGWLRLEGFAWQTQAAPVVFWSTLAIAVTFITTGWQEELFSRGYQLQNLADGLNLPWGVFLSSLVFGLLHLANPHATWISALGILAAGLFLAFGYIRTRQLWLPIGLHIGWNFFEGPVFGFPVSGLNFFPLTITRISGPALVTGGAFGPEAGLIVLPALLLGAGLILIYTRHRKS